MKEKKDTIIVNFFAGPGTGKSTYAAALFAHLKMLDVDCELVREYAKDLVWEHRTVEFQDQATIMGKQIKMINRCWGNVDVVVSDRPILLDAFYNENEPKEEWETICIARHNMYKSLNVFLVRKKKYNPNGRFQTEEEAKAMDSEMKAMLQKFGIPFIEIETGAAVTDIVVKELQKMGCKIECFQPLHNLV